MARGVSVAELPVGTVTLLFTDIEGSTRLLQQLGDRYTDVLAQHDRLLRAAVDAHGGRVVDTQGDAFFVAFGRAADAVTAAAAAQRALAAHRWPDDAEPRVRMGLHTGEPTSSGGGYVGLDVHRGARICAAGHGGQVLLSDAVRALAGRALPEGVGLRDLGEHRLKDLQQPERIFQLVIPDLRSEFPAIRTLETRPNNLPAQATPLIGREREIEAARALLLREGVRLVTLTGPPGIGKTRLGLQLAAELLDHFPDGVFFVGLAPISDPSLVASVIAQTLDTREAGGRPAFQLLKDALRDKRRLLVLDNFEQILPAAPLVAELLGACPGLKVLVMSRAVLRLSGEHDFAVPPLLLPAQRPLPPLDQLTQYEAVRLFIERARAAKADFAVTNENAPAVAEICHRLDGLPLAIELAAVHIRLLSPPAMLARLGRRLPLLTGGARDRPGRQQTLRDTIAWSHDLLDRSEQRLFRRLAVFVGGCTLEAAEAVCTVEGDLGIDVLDGLGSLVDKSLLRQGEQEREPRFGLLETTREFALEQLQASGELVDLRRRHAAYFLGLAEEAELKLRTAEQDRWMARLESEHDNLRAVLAWSHTEAGEAQTGLRLAGALGWFWYVHGHHTEGRRWLDTVLAAGSGAAGTVRAKALAAAGQLVQRQAEYSRATAMIEEALALYRAAEDTSGVAWSLSLLAFFPQGSAERATALLEESLALYRASGDAWGIAWALGCWGFVATQRGDWERAAPLLDESLAMFRRLGHTWGIARALSYLGRVEHALGNQDRAAELFEESLPRLRALDDTWAIALALNWLGKLVLDRGDTERAGALQRESLALFRTLDDVWGIAACLDQLAYVASSEGNARRAVRLLGAAEALRGTTGTRPPRAVRVAHERAVADLRAALGEEAFTPAWAEGRAMTPEQAIVYAVSDSVSR